MSYLVWRSQWLLLKLQGNKAAIRQQYQAYMFRRYGRHRGGCADQYDWPGLSYCFLDRAYGRASLHHPLPLDHPSTPWSPFLLEPFTSPLGEGGHYSEGNNHWSKFLPKWASLTKILSLNGFLHLVLLPLLKWLEGSDTGKGKLRRPELSLGGLSQDPDCG